MKVRGALFFGRRARNRRRDTRHPPRVAPARVKVVRTGLDLQRRRRRQRRCEFPQNGSHAGANAKNRGVALPISGAGASRFHELKSARRPPTPKNPKKPLQGNAARRRPIGGSHLVDCCLFYLQRRFRRAWKKSWRWRRETGTCLSRRWRQRCWALEFFPNLLSGLQRNHTKKHTTAHPTTYKKRSNVLRRSR